jgi:hypothetical protein
VFTLDALVFAVLAHAAAFAKLQEMSPVLNGNQRLCRRAAKIVTPASYSMGPQLSMELAAPTAAEHG